MKFFEVFRREIRQFTPVFVILVIAAVLTAASLGMGWISNADPPIKIKDSVGQGFLTILTGLAAVALLIERTLEVFVKSWRTSNREILDKALAYETNRLSFCRQQNDQHQIINAESAFLRAQMAVAEYKSQTSRLVTLSGAVLGMVIAAVAFPVLRDPLITNYATVLAANAFEPGVQYLFIAADIILTGGLLGGGAEGIHRVISVFTDFIEKTKSQTDPLASQPVRQRLPDPGKRPERLPTSPKDAGHAVGTPPQR